MQLHIVHMKRHYTDLMTALADPEGVAVLGFFYEVTIWIACFFKITKSVNYKFRQNEICYFPFSRCPTVQTESMMPLSVLCEPSKTQVGAEVQWKEVKLKRIAIVLMLSLFFPPRRQYLPASYLLGAADSTWAQPDLLLPLSGISDHTGLHRGCGLDLVREPHPTELWTG